VRVSSVTLEEVLAAAAARAASLVPETSGYLALAVGDATSRLPFRVEDRSVTLTTEGSVVVSRGSEVVPPGEAARVLRDMLSRLLARSVGTMPGLAAAGRTRDSERDTEAVVGELEAALIPVNRAAARRALARLARETLKAKESGRLRRRAARTAAVQAAQAAALAPVAVPPASPVAAPQSPAAILVSPAPTAAPAPAIAPAREDQARRGSGETGIDAVDVLFADTPLPAVAAAPTPAPPAARTPAPPAARTPASPAAPTPAPAQVAPILPPASEADAAALEAAPARSVTPLAEAVDAGWPEPSVPILLVARPAEVASPTTPVLGGMAVAANVDAVASPLDVALEAAPASEDVDVELHFTATPAPAVTAEAAPSPGPAAAGGPVDAPVDAADDALGVDGPPGDAITVLGARSVVDAIPIVDAASPSDDVAPVALPECEALPLETIAAPAAVEGPSATPGDLPAAEPTPTTLGVAWSEMELAPGDACPAPPPVASTAGAALDASGRPAGAQADASAATTDDDDDAATRAVVPSAPKPVMPRPRGADRRAGPRRRDGEGADEARGPVLPASETRLGAAPKSNVDDLLDSFSSSSRTFADERAVRAVAAGLKTMAGLEPTPLPPGVSLPTTPTPPPAAAPVPIALETLVAAGPARRSWLVPVLVLLVCAAATSGLLLAYPELLAFAG
jgi:hypothetical protein